MNIFTIISISRPRFWLYLAGTFLVGSALGLTSLTQIFTPMYWAYFVFFTIPANVFLYGINDYFDRETDEHNPKKDTKEHRLQVRETSNLKLWLTVSLILFLLLLLQSPLLSIKIALILFILLATLYRAPPIRFKARPYFDFISNAFYLLPGIIGYIYVTEQLPHPYLVLGISCWTWAMHLFSAIPDITVDKNAGITTSAVKFGIQNSLIVCGVLWSIFATVVISYSEWWPWSFFTLIYPMIAFVLVSNKEADLLKVYWYFPFINGFLGFGVYFLAVIRLLYG